MAGGVVGKDPVTWLQGYVPGSYPLRAPGAASQPSQEAPSENSTNLQQEYLGLTPSVNSQLQLLVGADPGKLW